MRVRTSLGASLESRVQATCLRQIPNVNTVGRYVSNTMINMRMLKHWSHAA